MILAQERVEQRPDGLVRITLKKGLEVSRLARNSTDWHRLLEIFARRGDPSVARPQNSLAPSGKTAAWEMLCAWTSEGTAGD